jgi:hypothetical protein
MKTMKTKASSKFSIENKRDTFLHPTPQNDIKVKKITMKNS